MMRIGPPQQGHGSRTVSVGSAVIFRHGDTSTSGPTASTPDGRWRMFTREELLQRDKASLDLFWLRDASMTDLANLPDPEVLAEEIMENLRSALRSFEVVGNA